VEEEVKNIVKEAVEETLKGANYQHAQVPKWSNAVVEQSLKRLTALNKPFKYVVTVVIHQNVGAGIQSATCAYFDTGTDGVVVCQRVFPAMLIIASVFAMVI